MTHRWPLRYRLIAVVVGLLAAAGAGIGALSTLALRDSLLQQVDARLADAQARGLRGLEATATELSSGTGEPAGIGVRGQAAGTIVLELRGNVFWAAYITSDGEVVDLPDEQARQILALPADGAERTMVLDDLGRYRTVSSVHGDVLTVTGLPLHDFDDAVARHALTTVLVTLGGVAAVGVVGYVLVRRELRPLDRVAATATRVAGLPLHRGEVNLADRVPDADTDTATEVGQVGAALNQLLGHVEDALGARQASETKLRQFVADASHELRTPLASIRGYAELVRRMPDDVPPDVLRAIGRVESEAVRMTSLVEDLLLLARLDSGRALGRRPVDLAALAADAVGDAHAAGQDHTWLLALPDGDGTDDDDAAGGAVVVGDEHALRQVLANLLSNARVHTPAGTTVTTTLTSTPGEVVLTVRDDGPGIDPELQERLFDRFFRGDAARSPGKGSTGLGLAIAQAVAQAHGGRITVDGTPGATAFTVTFPAPFPPPALGRAVPAPPPPPPALAAPETPGG